MKRFNMAMCSVFFLCAALLGSQHVSAQPWQTLVQPIGTLVKVWEPNDVNALLAAWDPNIIPGVTDPFDKNTQITEIQPTVPQHFVRFFSGSNPLGSWFMRSQFVRGLTPAQIKDRFALWDLPEEIVNLEVPAGSQYGLWTGIAAPIMSPGYEWGNGGGQQTKDIVNHASFPNYQWIPKDDYQHPQPIGQYALSYRPLAGGGNTGKVAAYLDRYIPEAYSDLENVYTDLDFLNWVGFGPDPLRKALKEITPERFVTLPFTVWRNGLLLGNALFDRRTHQYPCNPCCCQKEEECGCHHPRVSLIGLGEGGNGDVHVHGTRFDYNTWGIAATVDTKVCANIVAGAAFSGMMNHFSWKQHGGHGKLNHYQGALYANYADPRFFAGLLITGGWNRSDCHRHVRFHNIDRTAKSHQTGGDFSVQLQEGINFCFCDGWQFTPLVRVIYSCISEKHFEEHGAQSLNLSVRPWTSEILRGYIECGLTRGFNFEGCCLFSKIYAGYAYDGVLGGKHIHASLDHLCGSFASAVWCQNQDSAFAGASLTLASMCGIDAYLRYDAQLNSRYTSQSGELGLDYKF